jgi:hypothetical protein
MGMRTIFISCILLAGVLWMRPSAARSSPTGSPAAEDMMRTIPIDVTSPANGTTVPGGRFAVTGRTEPGLRIIVLTTLVHSYRRGFSEPVYVRHNQGNADPHGGFSVPVNVGPVRAGEVILYEVIASDNRGGWSDISNYRLTVKP